MTERLHFHFSLSCIGEGNGNPLQCSCLENPRDGGAWWAVVYGVTQSRTWLKWLSSSSSKEYIKAAYCHPAYLTYMPSTSCKYADDTTLMAEIEEELKSLLMRVKEENEKAGLKLSIQKKNHGIWYHHFMANRWGKSGSSDRFYFLGLQNHWG